MNLNSTHETYPYMIKSLMTSYAKNLFIKMSIKNNIIYIYLFIYLFIILVFKSKLRLTCQSCITIFFFKKRTTLEIDDRIIGG